MKANIEDLYELSPIQEGILFHELYDPKSRLYFNQLVCEIQGALDIAVFERALQQIVGRHPVLRTSFHWEKLQKPIQVVHKEVDVKLEQVDWRSVPASEQESRLMAYMDSDRRRGVEVSRPPLMRFTLIRKSEESFQFLWSYHHLLIDGWSKSAIVGEIVAVYEALRQGRQVELMRRRPFVDYIRWLQLQDISGAENFWRQTLGGFKSPTDLTSNGKPAGSTGGQDGPGRKHCQMAEPATEALRSLARLQQLTLNTVIQGAWGLLLSHRSGTNDVVFGAVTSGRPPSLQGAEAMIGLFINTLPVRVVIPDNEPFVNTLRRLQRQQASMRQFECTPLVQVQGWSEVPRGVPLFQTILTFENYPVESSGRGRKLGIEVRGVRHISRNNYLLTLLVEPSARLTMQLLYDGRRFKGGDAGRILQQMETLLAVLAVQPEITPGKMKEILSDKEGSQQKMEELKQDELDWKKLMTVKPRAVTLATADLVKTGRLIPNSEMPLVIEPSIDDIEPLEWAETNRDFIERELLKHGALLFRGFRIKPAAEFEQFAGAICRELFGDYGDLPRENMGGKVYGSTPYPADQTILFHNESSHMHRWPHKIFFNCVKAAEQGGETPIVDCRKIYERLDSQLRERFARLELMYVRNYIEGVDVSWSQFFHTTDRSAVERYCKEASISFEWREGNGLRTRQVCPAVLKHPITGEMTFFNQIQLHHISCLDPMVRESMLSMLPQEELPRNVYYGDGSVIEDSVVKEIMDVYWDVAVSFRWQETDVLLLDNMLTAHARLPYTGPRKIVAAMGEMIERSQLLSH